MKKRYIAAAILAACALIALSSCSQALSGLQDGYYSAQMDGFDEYGWQEYVTISVKNGRINSVEYNARNPSGFIKSWDMEYMRQMGALCPTYPNDYTRKYSAELISSQNYEDIDVVSGATHSYHKFKSLGAAVIERAKSGISEVAIVPIE